MNIPTVVSKKFIVEVTQKIEHVNVVDNMHAVKITTTWTPECSSLQKTPSETIQFIVNDTNLQKLLEGESYDKEKLMVLVSDDFIETASVYGYVAAIDRHAICYTVFDDWIKSKPSSKLIANHWESHMLFDHVGNVLPTAIKFDFPDSAYHLNELHNTLKGISPNAISYLSEIRQTMDGDYFEVTFAPTHEQMNHIWKKAKELSTKYSRASTNLREAVIELDFLRSAQHRK